MDCLGLWGSGGVSRGMGEMGEGKEVGYVRVQRMLGLELVICQHLCVCVCVCMCEREREGGREGGRERGGRI